ncbi:SBBP repeat beta-propeller lipoprotein, LipL53 family [Leptospira borgpetersenii]|uniref:SBBP repeat beta-propeller lipoprotein, LipL53 family n=1 Tax=Leptospira borgpetersenii TaxID=174 RepID=UPI0007746FBE|nr:SBBP repeat-containing protein [Leptospira borgpetersenii]MBE8400236.1 SBBP repeat-containing protein [Leptospira borgpetersenii serovar Tarassovi]MBE8402990.1 SBBP repeat-containing protein [Leptospira borgpetersenii serovar Tarassovi]MBE8406503.1 SBBP repeat-containing protein [Leptospira borgpetersenii serovar Tarassovi]MBE8412006.1 SBBP repeat-containing protein [Leptospira borgpetersenii serovar Tarassovi]MBE8417052.1 SBBP repeat-containing protein [Leptospira borgpetersenii serovar Ta
MIHLLILFSIFLFQVCSPTSDAKTNDYFLIPLVQGNNIGSIAVHGNLDSLDVQETPLRENSVSLEWASLYGGNPNKITRDSKLAVDEKGFVYVAADIDSDPSYDELTNKWIRGGQDLILAKYDSRENIIWMRSIPGVLGTKLNVTGIAVDPEGNAYVTGSIIGSLENIPVLENQDMFVIKFDSNGVINWIKQTGVNDKRYEVSPQKITVDTFGNSYIVGTSNGPFGGNSIKRGNGFIVKLDTNGNQIWIEQLSIPGAEIIPVGVAFDKITGNIYMSGFGRNANFATNSTPGIGENDLFILKYDSNGNRQFFAQLGVPLKSVFGKAITVDRFGNVLVGGYSNADFGLKPDETGYLGTIVKYDSSGVQQWIRQFGPPTAQKTTIIDEITTDRAGNVFTTGQTNGFIKFNAGPSEGDQDVFVTKHSSSGEVRELWQWGIIRSTMVGSGIGADFDGNLYSTGWATRNVFHELFGNEMMGAIDTFLIKFR